MVAHPDLDDNRRDKWTAALLAFTLGIYGAHKFYMGEKRVGNIILIITLVCVGLIFFTNPAHQTNTIVGTVNAVAGYLIFAAIWPLAVIEGLFYLFKPGERFYDRHQKNKWMTILIAALAGAFGAHKFYLGKSRAGLITLTAFVSVILFYVLLFVLFFRGIATQISSFAFFALSVPHFVFMAIIFITVIEIGIYYSMPQKKFQATYVDGNRAWF